MNDVVQEYFWWRARHPHLTPAECWRNAIMHCCCD